MPPIAAGKKVPLRIGIYDPTSHNYDRLKIGSAAGVKIDDAGNRADIETVQLK